MALHVGAEVASAVPSGGSPPLSVISQNLLETAAYERSGADLVLVSDTGERLTIAEYFASSNPPNLTADNGAFLSGATVSLLAGGSTVHVAQAGATGTAGALRIGLVETLAGTATAQHLDGSVTNLKTGDPVFQGDVVKVSGDGKLGLSFLDKSVFSLSGGGTMTLNEMIYNPDSTTTNKMVFGLVNGSLSFVTGAVAPTGGVTIETPVAVMAIRGTIPIALDVGGGKYLILSDQGQFEVFPKLPGSEVLTINDAGKAIYFPLGLAGAPQVIDLAGSGLEDDVALLITQLNEARQAFLERRAGATGSPDFAIFEEFEWIEGGVILTQLTALLSPLLEATELTQSETSGFRNASGRTEDEASDTASVITGKSTATLTETDAPQSASGILSISGADYPAAVFVAQANVLGGNGYGSFTIDADGHWTYVMASAQDGFVAGQDYTDQITVTTTDGTTQVITVTITGSNDAPVAIAAMNAVAENAVVTGSVSGSDADNGETASLTYALAGSAPAGLTFNSDGSYSFDAASYDSLAEGEELELSITFTATDAQGTASEPAALLITLIGTNDQAVIGGMTTGSVTEDIDLYASGNLTIRDADAGEAEFREQASFAGSYGTFSLDADGSWTYSLNNTHPDVQKLNDGQTLTDSFTAVSADESSSQLVEVTINGATDIPVPPPPYTGNDDPNDFDSLRSVAVFEPEVAYETGESGRQTWNGTDDRDEISAGESDDTVYGHGGDDVIGGNGGNDAGNGGGNGNGLYGQAGNDTITGGAGKDQIYGGSGDDVIYGGTNPYTASGPSDQDVLYGGSGSDTLYGQDGDDDLIGGYGADTLYGGDGADNFIYLDAKDTGDTIEDFIIGEDEIDLTELLDAGNLDSGGNTASVSANSFNWFQDGANTIVTADVTGDSVADFAITLKGVDASDVQENSFAY